LSNALFILLPRLARFAIVNKFKSIVYFVGLLNLLLSHKYMKLGRAFCIVSVSFVVVSVLSI
jgi:hypothetical protein